jgi:hypothetical protein
MYREKSGNPDYNNKNIIIIIYNNNKIIIIIDNYNYNSDCSCPAGGSQPSELRSVEVDVWDNAQCSSSYGNQAPGGIIDSMICAAKPDKDSCSVSALRWPCCLLSGGIKTKYEFCVGRPKKILVGQQK